MGALAALTVAGIWRVLPAIKSGEAHLDRRRMLGDALKLPRLLIVCAVTRAASRSANSSPSPTSRRSSAPTPA